MLYSLTHVASVGVKGLINLVYTWQFSAATIHILFGAIRILFTYLITWHRLSHGRQTGWLAHSESTAKTRHSVLGHCWLIGQSKGLDWIEQCFTSPPTQYRLYGRRFLQVKRPNQQYQSAEGTHSTQTNQTYNRQTWTQNTASLTLRP